MKRKLLTQIKNEWRDNIWMVLELTVVTGVIWLISTIIYMTVKGYFLPRGFDYEGVYTMKVHSVVKDSPYYMAPADEEEKPYEEDLRAIVDRLRENPNVASVTVENNGTPYNYNYSGTRLFLMDTPDSIGYNGNQRLGTPGLAQTLGFESLTGKTPEQLDEILSKGEILISNNEVYEQEGGNVMELLGARMIHRNDSSIIYRVGDIIRKVRRNDYEDSWGGTIVFPLAEKSWGDVAVKLHPGHERRFSEDFRSHPELHRQRNVYLSDLTPLADTRESCQRQYATGRNTMVCLMIFLLVTIFLGLLGTFWFRMQQRVGEIALRKVCGATKWDIFRRVIGEGMILLTVASVLMSAIIWSISGIFIDMFQCTLLEFFIFEIVAIAVVAVGLVLSLWYPARRAMLIEPAIALKSE